LSNDLFKYFNLLQSIRVLCLRKTDLHGKIRQCLRKNGDYGIISDKKAFYRHGKGKGE